MQSNNNNIVVYFDFDGTITTRDTLLPFLVFVVGWRKLILKIYILLPIILIYWGRLITNEQAKQMILRVLLKDYSVELLNFKAEEFATVKLDVFLRADVYAKLKKHLELQHTVILVSANLAIYLRHWAYKHKIDAVIATEIEIIEEKFTGKLLTHNCYGVYKTQRVNEFLEQFDLDFAYSYAYGNSRGDYELLDYADKAYFVTRSKITPWIEYREKFYIKFRYSK